MFFACFVAPLRPQNEPPTFLKGERIDYSIKLRGVGIGRASLVYQGVVNLGGRKARKVVFSTDTFNFKDKETIYADVETFLPLRIEREINNWGRKMYITEDYDQANNTVTITKNKKGRISSRRITQDGNLQNVILLTYLYRKSGDFTMNKHFPVTLPLRKMVMRVEKQEKIKTPYGTFMSYLVNSSPRGQRIWFGTTSKALPLQIAGGAFFGSTRLVIIGYQEGG